MHTPRGWFSQRGSAILGGLALVAVLGIIAVALDGSMQKSNLAAQTAVAAAGATPAAPGNVSADDKNVEEQCKAGYRYEVKVEATGKVTAPPEQIIDCTQPPDSEYAKQRPISYQKYCVPKVGEVLECTQTSPNSSQCNLLKYCREGASAGVPKASAPSGAASPGGGEGAEVPSGPTAPGGSNTGDVAGGAFNPAETQERYNNLKTQCDAGNCDAKDYQQLLAYEKQMQADETRKNLQEQCDAGNCDAKDFKILEQLKADAVEVKSGYGTGAAPTESACAANPSLPGCSSASPPDCKPGQPCNVPTPRARPGNTFTPPPSGPENKSGFGGLGSLGNLGSLLSGLMRGMGGGAPQQAQAQQCATDQGAYQQQQQQYQQQLQQYNYQLQQYNYQMQQYQYQQQYGGYGTGFMPQAPVMPVPCTPSTGDQCRSQPPQPDPSLCNQGSWVPTRNGSCISGWRCSSGDAQLSCQPKTADVGMQLALTYSCASGTASGSGFTVTTQPSGSATTTVARPPSGTNTATYTLTCTDNGRTTGAHCSVQVNQPSIILVANPKNVPSGEESLIGWITAGMKACVVSSPDQADFTARNSANTSVSGAATTSPITQRTTFLLHCETLAGGTKNATTTVGIGNPGDPDSTVTISSDADGETVKHGDKITITWNATGQPSGSAVALWLVDMRTNYTSALIAGGKGLSGTFEWTLPTPSSPCAADAANVCASDLVVGRQYAIEADVYTPSNAYVGDGPRPSNAIDPAYGDYQATDPVFTIGQ